MATSPQTFIPAKPINRRWLWAVRIAALLGPSIFWVGILPDYLPPGACADWSSDPSRAVVGILITLPYLHILLRLAGPTYERGLAMAETTGAIGILTAGLALYGLGSAAARYAAWIMASQAALLTTAVATYYLMGRKAGGTRTLLRGLVATLAYLALFLLGVASQINRVASVNQASPVGSLRTINTAEVTYSSTYTQGFSPTLAALGPGPDNAPPNPSAAGLIDNVLASGQGNRYTFTYTPGPRDANGTIQTYTVSARPNLECQKAGFNSYFTDQTGVIRMTNEDRPATVHDPPLAG